MVSLKNAFLFGDGTAQVDLISVYVHFICVLKVYNAINCQSVSPGVTSVTAAASASICTLELAQYESDNCVRCIYGNYGCSAS